MERKSYIVESPMPISFDIPKINIVHVHFPVKALLSDEEVRILTQSIPNIKIVPEIIPVTPEPKAKKILLVEDAPVEPVITATPEPEPTPEVPAEEETLLPEHSDVEPPVIHQTLSMNLSLNECIAHMQTLTSVAELKAFVSAGDTRKGLLEEVKKRTQELTK